MHSNLNQVAVSKRYKFSQGELKRLLGIEGNITHIGLWRGRSPLEVEQRQDPDTLDEWYIDTIEVNCDAS